MNQAFTDHVGIEVPIICGAMYPCSNPELIAAVSEAGGMGMIQPISMMYVHKHDLRDGIRLIRKTTKKPIGFNAIVEKSSQVYEDRMRKWVDIALEEGVRFFVTALGNPRWVVDAVHAVGGVVYHNVTNRRWALKALEQDVDGLICVNQRAGGHAGEASPQKMLADLGDLGVPLICAGGIGSAQGFADAISMGYGGVQLGTRFIATRECRSHNDYKQAIVKAREEDIVLTDKISGVPVAVINTPFVQRIGTEAGWVARQLLQHPKGKHYMRMFYSLKSMWQLGKASREGAGYRDYFQAGKSVAGIEAIVSAGDVVREYAAALQEQPEESVA